MGQKGLTSIEDHVMATYQRLKKEGYTEAGIKDTTDYQGAKRSIDLSKVGIPTRIIDTVNMITESRDLENPIARTKAVVAVDAWLKTEADAWCLVLSGNKGCGKSSAAGWWLQNILKELQHENRTYKQSCCKRWHTAGTLAGWSRNPGDAALFINTVKECNSIVIDDLGSEYVASSGYFNSVLDEIIDARYSNYKRTLITTNLNADEFHARYGDRVSDRIRAGFRHAGPVGDTLFIEIPDKSMRG